MSDYEENDEWIDNSSEEDIENQEMNPITKKSKSAHESEQQGQGNNNRQDQKALLKERKMQKPNAPLLQKAKKLWEQIRQKKTEKSSREILMKEMMELIQGKALDVFLYYLVSFKNSFN